MQLERKEEQRHYLLIFQTEALSSLVLLMIEPYRKRENEVGKEAAIKKFTKSFGSLAPDWQAKEPRAVNISRIAAAAASQSVLIYFTHRSEARKTTLFDTIDYTIIIIIEEKEEYRFSTISLAKRQE